MPLLWRLAYRNVWRNPRRSLITVIAVALGVWSSASLSSLARGISWGMAEDSIRNLTGHLYVTREAFLDDPVIEHAFPTSLLREEALLQEVDVTAKATRLRVPGVIMSERESFGVVIVGIDPGEERGLSYIPEAVARGEFLESPQDGGILLGERLLDLLETGVGKRVVLLSESVEDTLAERGFRIKGTFRAKLQATEQAYVFVGRETLQKMLGAGDLVTELSILLRDRDGVGAAREILRPKVPSLAVSTWSSLQPFVVALIDIQSKFIGFWFIIVFVAVSFGVVNTLLMSIFERTRELGLLQALGMKPWHLIVQVVFESVTLVLIGSVIGNAMAMVTVWISSGGIDVGIFAKGAEYVGGSRIVYPVIYLADWIEANLVVLVMGVLSSILPAWKAARLRPVEALQRG